MRKSFVVLGEAQDKNFQSPTEGVLLPMPVFWRHLVGGEEAYLQGWNHERPVAAPAPPTAEGMESLRAVDLGAPTSGARLNLVGDFVRLRRYAHINRPRLFSAWRYGSRPSSSAREVAWIC